MNFNLDNYLPDELKENVFYKATDFTGDTEIFLISKISEVDYYNKKTLMLSLNDDARMLPLNTPNKLKTIIGILGRDVNSWTGKEIGIRQAEFYDKVKGETIVYVALELPQRELPLNFIDDDDFSDTTNLSHPTLDDFNEKDNSDIDSDPDKIPF